MTIPLEWSLLFSSLIHLAKCIVFLLFVSKQLVLEVCKTLLQVTFYLQVYILCLQLNHEFLGIHPSPYYLLLIIMSRVASI